MTKPVTDPSRSERFGSFLIRNSYCNAYVAATCITMSSIAMATLGVASLASTVFPEALPGTSVQPGMTVGAIKE